MRIIIGISQNKDDVAKLMKKRTLNAISLTEVGPFFSKNQALSWMNELHSRIDNSEIAFVSDASCKELKWFGFTFEK